MAKNWKYTKEKTKFDLDEYLKLDIGVPAQVRIKLPEVIKKLVDGYYRSVFQGTAIEKNGEATEKIVIIKNYDNVATLKKKIAGKKEINLELTRQYNDDEMETYFDIKVIRKIKKKS